MKKTKNIIIDHKAIEKRQKFLDTYKQLYDNIISIGFRWANYNESMTYADVSYKYYENYIDSLSGIQHFKHDILRLSLRFICDRNKHFIMFVDPIDIGCLYSIDQAFMRIKRWVSDIKNIELYKLKSINV